MEELRYKEIEITVRFKFYFWFMFYKVKVQRVFSKRLACKTLDWLLKDMKINPKKYYYIKTY